MRLRDRTSARSRLWLALPMLLVAPLLSSCSDTEKVIGPGTGPTDPGPDPTSNLPLGVYQFTVTGIGGGDMKSVGEPQPVLVSTPLGTGALAFEPISVSSFVDGSRSADGQRYVMLHYRVRNTTGSTLSNVVLIPNSTANTINGSPWVRIRRFDGSNAADSLANLIVPTGSVSLADDATIESPFPDVLQVFQESEVAALTKPDSVTGLFPYGFVVRNRDESATSRDLPVATDANDFDGILTFAFRFPLESSASEDPFSFTFLAVAYEDSETRITESMEEASDTAAVARLRDRISQINATVTTVLPGSTTPLASITDYPGQRQICSVRTAGSAGSPTRYINAPAALSHYLVMRPGESVDSCQPEFRTGVAGRPATGVPFTLTLVAMDHYGNVKTSAVDTVRLEQRSGPSISIGSSKAISSGQAQITVTYNDYGTSYMEAVGRRVEGGQPVSVDGVTRNWTGGVSTNWATGGNWAMGAVPMNRDTVSIPTGTTYSPVLTGTVSVAGVYVTNGATLSLGTYTLNDSGNALTGTSGGITSSTGTLNLTGTTGSIAGVLPRTILSGSYSLTGDVTATSTFRIDGGRATAAGYRLTVAN